MTIQSSLFSKKIILLAITIVGINSSVVFAAGPRPKDFYLNLGGGVFSPDFVLERNATVKGVDGDSAITFVGISVPFVGVDQPLQLVGLYGDGDVAKGRPENRPILSLGAVLGYKYNDYFGLEAHLDLGFPNILIRDVQLGNVLESDTQSTGRIQILAPELLPIGASIVYTPIPDYIVSPYIGVGAMIALLDNRRAQSQPTDIMILDGGISYGYIVHAGAYLDLSNTWFGFFDVKYASIPDPKFTTRQNEPAPVAELNIRHIRVGAGIRF